MVLCQCCVGVVSVCVVSVLCEYCVGVGWVLCECLGSSTPTKSNFVQIYKTLFTQDPGFFSRVVGNGPDPL